ncbi:MAG: HD domain-containing protein [Chlorobiales bacterium]|nr:HD domain-containing protein [Chlorobiales bacterium]
MISDNVLFRSEGGFIRIPVWGHIPLSAPLKKILTHPAFLRLKSIRQLSFSQQVYPGANHTRFEHSIGVYHLMKLILQRILTNPLAESLQDDNLHFDNHTCKLLLASTLLHDIGHYPHAHVLEGQAPVYQNKPVFAAHESLINRFLFESYEGFEPVSVILENEWQVDPVEVTGIITGKTERFKKLISGTLDPDKMDYLMRDAHHCNIPYGSIDIERLIESFVPDPRLQRFAITEKGIAPLESLLFTKYMMMRNVYWHHTSRTFSVMLRRMLQDAVDAAVVSPNELRALFYDNSDDRVLHELTQRLNAAWPPSGELLHNIMQRKIYKRALTLSPYRNGANEQVSWMFAYATDHVHRTKKESSICEILNRHGGLDLQGHEVLIDPPSLKDVFDYADLRELRIYPTRREHLNDPRSAPERYIRFDDFGESVFLSDFILLFERYTKKFRIVCRDDLCNAILMHQDEIIEALKE